MKTSPTVLEIPDLHPLGKTIQVSFGQLEGSPEYRALPKEVLQQFEDLYLKIQERPKKNIRYLKELFQKFPHVPEIANLLTFALLKLKKRKEAEQLITMTFQTNPHHLIARINYADQLIRQRKKEEIPQLISLDALLREKEHFHYLEFRGLMVVMGFYHLEMEEAAKAEEYYQLAFQVDPFHPSVATLEKKISRNAPNLFRNIPKKCIQLLQNLARISKNP